MKKTSLIITEKGSVSRAIVRALNPESFDDRDSCNCEHNEIVSIRPRERGKRSGVYEEGRCVAEPNKSSKFEYFCSRDCSTGCGFYAEHTDSQSKAHYLSTKKRLGFQNRGKGRWDKTIFENIGYYVFDKGDETIIVADTSGNPLSLRINTRGKRSLEQLFRETSDWKDIEKRSRYTARVDWFSRKSSEVRARLFNHILAKRQLPDGTPIDLDRVIAATDYDVAGSHIFQSIINNANGFVKWKNSLGKNMKDISPDMIYRMKLQSMDPQDIIKEFEAPLEFDYQNAAAGEIRSMMDMAIGGSLTSELNYNIRTGNRGSKCRVSVGRNRFLGLEELIKEEQGIGEESERAYLIFEGNQDLESIEDSLARKDFLGLQIKSTKKRVSHSDYLIALKDANVGTHTTRNKIYSQLARSGVINFSDLELRTTPFGMEYYRIMSPHLRGPMFDIKSWNNFLHDAMIQIREGGGIGNIDSAKESSREFMRYFHQNFRNYLIEMRPKWSEISREIADSFERLGGEKSILREKVKHTKREKGEGLELFGGNVHLSEDQIGLFMNASSNIPTTSGETLLTRYIPGNIISPEESIRRVCCIGRSHDFEVVRGNPLEIIDLEGRGYTVFSSEVKDGNGLGGFPEDILRFEETALEDEGKEELLVAHEPLEIKDVSPGIIAGGKGFDLVREYNAPWMNTLNALRLREGGKIDVESFETDVGEFKRVNRYELGKVHNYESLLIAMFEKYKIPFRETAEMAEDLYLGK